MTDSMTDSIQVDDSIQRYGESPQYGGAIGSCGWGDYVKYEDHLKAVQAAVEEALIQERETRDDEMQAWDFSSW